MMPAGGADRAEEERIPQFRRVRDLFRPRRGPPNRRWRAAAALGRILAEINAVDCRVDG